ncbi:MAG: FAD:protein FMN transferase [Lacisediminihabitans sp.]
MEPRPVRGAKRVGEHSISRDALRAVFSETGTLPAEISRREPLMGGHATITLVGASTVLLDAAFAIAERCEALWSRFITTSDITRLNWAEGQPTTVDPLTVYLIEAMRDGSVLTDGDYDPTLLPDVLAAGYAASTVDSSRITTLPASAVAPGSTRGIAIDGQTVTLPLGTTLDPGGIGKGLAADLVCGFALAEGAWGVMAELGGDVVVAGQAPDGVAWRLGVENPFDPSQHSAVVRLARGSIVTSSQRKRRWATETGDRHHLINPHTHMSAQTNIQTVSVIASSGARAETLTKPGFLRDTAEYLAWLPSVGAAGIVIDELGAMTASENWTRYS